MTGWSSARRTQPMVVTVAMLAALLAGCGTSSRAKADAPTPTATSLPTATATATPALVAPSVCSENGGAQLSVTKEYLHNGYGPGEPEGTRLPDDLTLRPQIVATSLDMGHLSLRDNTLAFFDFSQPSSGQTGYICGVTLRIESFQPLPEAVPNVTATCADQWYEVPGGWLPSTACAAAPLPAGAGSATFTSSLAGTMATASVTAPTLPPSDSMRPGQEPSSLDALGGCGPTGHCSTLMSVGIKVPQAGTYTFSVRFWQDRAGPSVAAPDITETFALGQMQREWGGEQCKAADMQAQLPPPTDPPTRVICPGAYPPQR
jgi:hypothetical protein